MKNSFITLAEVAKRLNVPATSHHILALIGKSRGASESPG
jgi:hypothetical protein